MKVLFDTSLLLPTLGVEVERASRILEKLIDYELYYSDFSIFEWIWIINLLERKDKFNRDAFETGMKNILECYAKAKINAGIVLNTFKIY